MKKIVILMMIAMLAISPVLAIPGEVDAITPNLLGNYASTAGGNLGITSGEVYDADVQASVSTFVWSALTGQVGGTIVLGINTAQTDRLYTWTALGRMVYASTANTIDWSASGLEAATQAHITAEAAHIDRGAADDWNETFIASESLQSELYDYIIANYVDTFDSAEAATWRTYSLHDATNGELVWAGLVNEEGDLFDGNPGDYQMIVPEDGTGNNVIATTYYLWAELV